jgi:hypothetical protein
VIIVYGVLLHFVGDYLVQTNWMANEKVNKWLPAWIHAVTYTLPFLLLTRNVWALLIICVTHAIIDHYRLAKHFIWAKNFLFDPRIQDGFEAKWTNDAGYSYSMRYSSKYDALDARAGRPIHSGMSVAPPWAKPVYLPRTTWAEAKENGGFAKSTPPFMAIWLMIITDNIFHILINSAALVYFT